MKKLLFFCGVAAVLCSSCGKRIARVESVDIVPQPVSVVASDGAFDLTKNTKICLLSDDSTLNYSVRLFNGLLDKSFGKPLPVIKSTQPEAGAINVRLGGLQPEEYTLNIRPDGVDITGGSPAGVFYAFQTLRQLLPVAVARGEKAGVIELPVAEIADISPICSIIVASAIGAITMTAVGSNLHSWNGGSPTQEAVATSEKFRIALPSGFVIPIIWKTAAAA